MQVSKEVEFDAAHRVPYHASKCAHLHGHRYKVRATVDGIVLPDADVRPDAGMVVDFGAIKSILTREVHDLFDHRTIVWQHDTALYEALHRDFADSIVLVPFIPTAENLAHYIVDLVSVSLVRLGVEDLRLCRLDVWETPTSVATWTR